MAHLGEDRDDEDDEDSGPRLGERAARVASEVAHHITEDYARLFDREEADEALAEVADILVTYGGYLNQFMSYSNASETPCDIWDLDPDEAKPLARIWLRWAQRNVQVAATLRLAREGDDYFRSLMILGPRVVASAQWYPTHGGFRLKDWRMVDAEADNVTRLHDEGPGRGA